MFLNLGFSDAELDREIRETRERQYIHGSGDTPVHITTFGMIQEYLTDNWHGLIAGLMKNSAPEAAYIANRIKQRETLHTVWYRDMDRASSGGESWPDRARGGGRWCGSRCRARCCCQTCKTRCRAGCRGWAPTSTI